MVRVQAAEMNVINVIVLHATKTLEDNTDFIPTDEFRRRAELQCTLFWFVF